jgi:hypothetical protein
MSVCKEDTDEPAPHGLPGRRPPVAPDERGSRAATRGGRSRGPLWHGIGGCPPPARPPHPLAAVAHGADAPGDTTPATSASPPLNHGPSGGGDPFRGSPPAGLVVPVPATQEGPHPHPAAPSRTGPPESVPVRTYHRGAGRQRNHPDRPPLRLTHFRPSRDHVGARQHRSGRRKTGVPRSAAHGHRRACPRDSCRGCQRRTSRGTRRRSGYVLASGRPWMGPSGRGWRVVRRRRCERTVGTPGRGHDHDRRTGCRSRGVPCLAHASRQRAVHPSAPRQAPEGRGCLCPPRRASRWHDRVPPHHARCADRRRLPQRGTGRRR